MADFRDFLSTSTNENTHKALELFFNYGQIDGSHHKTWTIDQAARLIAGENYERFVHFYQFECSESHSEAEVCAIESRKIESGDYYEWDTGIAP